MRVIAVDVRRVRGQLDRITEETAVRGELEFVPTQDGRALLMLPISVLIEENANNRHRGIMEMPALSKADLRLRGVLDLTKRETAKLLTAKPGEIISIKRKGWGREWVHTVRRGEET